MYHEVEVTAEHIRQGVPRAAGNCAISLAVKDSGLLSDVSTIRDYDGDKNIRAYLDASTATESRRYLIEASVDAAQWIYQFDTQLVAVEPFSFKVNID